MNKNWTSVLFDLDGTLVDSSEGIFNSIRMAQETLRLPEISAAQMRTHIGPSPEDAFSRSFGLSGEALREAVTVYKKFAFDYGCLQARLYDGIAELLRAIRKRGCKTGVATLKMERAALKMLTFLQAAPLLDCVKGAMPDIKPKKSEIINNCVDLLGLDKSSCVFVGDSEYDARGAAEAGVDFIGVTYGFGFESAADVARYDHARCAASVEELALALR